MFDVMCRSASYCCTTIQQVGDGHSSALLEQQLSELDPFSVVHSSLAPAFRESDLENALWQFARELNYFGVSLEQVLCPLLSLCVSCLQQHFGAHAPTPALTHCLGL